MTQTTTADQQRQVEILVDFIDRIEANIDAGNLSAAKDLAYQCKRDFPQLPIADYLLAVFYLSTTEYSQALIHIDVCLSRHHKIHDVSSGEYLKAACLRAQILWRLGSIAYSQELLLQIGTQNRCAQAYLILAAQAVEIDDYAAAATHYKAGILVDPTNLELWYLQAQLQYHYFKNLGAARASLNAALSVDNHCIKVLELSVRLELGCGNYVKANGLATMLLNVDALNELALSASFFSCLHLGSWERAQGLLPMLLAINPDKSQVYLNAYNKSYAMVGNSDLVFNRDTLFNSGILAYRQGEFDRALALLQRASDLDPGRNDVEICTWMANCHAKLDRHALAVSVYERADLTDIDASSLIDIYRGWAHSWMCLDRPDKAISLFEAAFALDPDDLDTMLGLGVCYGSNRTLDKAIATCARALELHPTDTTVAIAYVTYLLDDGQVDLAAETAGKMMQIAPLDPNSHYLSGVVYHRLGHNYQALGFAIHYLRNNQGNPLATDLYLKVTRSLDEEFSIQRNS